VRGSVSANPFHSVRDAEYRSILEQIDFARTAAAVDSFAWMTEP